MVQVPDSFGIGQTCIVTAPSSGSRGVYGAIATAGEWGLKRGCAVAYTDKGTGMGVHDLSADTVNLITGERVPANSNPDRINFRADLGRGGTRGVQLGFPQPAGLETRPFPRQPESRWGQDVLDSIEVAFAVLNIHHPGPNGRRHTPTTPSSSHPAYRTAAALRCVPPNWTERADRRRRRVGAQRQAHFDPSFTIRQGDQAPLAVHSRPLYDTITLVNLYQPCAALSVPARPSTPAASAGRCEGLFRNGLLKSAGVPAQAAEAQAIINGYGILAEQNFLQPSYSTFFVPQSIAVTYANAYARAGVEQNLCGYSFAYAENGVPAPLPPVAAANLFATGNGIPPTGKVVLINNNAPGGAHEDRHRRPTRTFRAPSACASLATDPLGRLRASLGAFRPPAPCAASRW